MGKNADSTGTSKVPSFSSIKAYERRAVILRGQGQPYEVIKEHINAEFALNYKEPTVREWFIAGGKLEQAYHEYNTAMAEQSLKEAKQVLLRAQRAAATGIVGQFTNPDPRVAQKAMLSVLNKYIPDKQIMLEGPVQDSDLPPELGEEGDKIIESANTDPQHRAADEPAAGDGQDQAVPTGVLPEQPAPDGPSDPAT